MIGDENNKPTILVVDDSSFAVSTMHRCLGRHYRILSVSNGADAISSAVYKNPDLILMDIMMPGMNGIDATEKIKSDPRTQHIPIIMMTSLADHNSEAMALRAGASDYVHKPINLEVTLLRINKLLEGRT